MNFLYEMIVVLEIIFVNQIIFKKNVKARYPGGVVLVVLLLYSIGLMMMGIVLIKSLGIYGNGNGLFTLMGFCYLLPLHFLFEGSSWKHFYVICFAWVYTLSVFSIAVQLSYMNHPILQPQLVMIFQTILFATTFCFVSRFVNSVYIKIMNCSDEQIQRYLNVSSLLWFLTIFMVNLHFIFEDHRIISVGMLLILGGNACYGFLLIFELLVRRKEIGSLESIVAKDTLTGLGSRIAFDQFLNDQIDAGIPFSFVYMDLDEFKKVNDQYGHLMGDNYLKEFAKKLLDIEEVQGRFRISGDEFVMLVDPKEKESVETMLREIRFTYQEMKFQGVSFGIADFPQDAATADELINQADQRMYEEKQQKK